MRLALITSLALSSLCGQQYPDGEVLSKQTETAMKKFRSLRYREDTTIETAIGGQKMKITSETSRAFVNPGKMRMESKGQGATVTIVSDGESTWVYSSVNNEYTQKSAGLGPEGIISAMGISEMMPDTKDLALKRKTTGEDSVVIDGQKHDCWVVRTDMGTMKLPEAARGAKIEDAVITTWIDKKLGIDLQNETTMKVAMGAMSTDTHIHTVKKELQIDAPIPDSLFAFTPPDGAKQVEKLSVFGAPLATPALAGKAAPDFTLKAMDGKTYSLAELKGKPVFLDFWATWCGPCRKAIPSVEKFFHEYKGQDLAVLAIDAGEEQELVEGFLKKTPLAYPVALSGESKVLSDYQVKGYPTFVLIDREGKIAAYELGFGGEEMLLGMFEKAGLGPKK